MTNDALRPVRALVTLTALAVASLGAAGCDQDGVAGGEVTFRPGGGVGGTTFNTDNNVSPGARDMYEFNRTGAWHTNSFGFQTKLKKVIFDHPQYGVISTDPSKVPDPFSPRVAITSAGNLEVTVYPPFGGAPQSFSGDEIVGLELLFKVQYNGSPTFDSRVRVTQRYFDPLGGDLYELVKVNPIDGTVLGAICEVGPTGDRNARIYEAVSIDGISGAVVEVPNIYHVACTAGAPGKTSLYGYFPSGAPESFRLANRVLRADYCADGYPFTYPGNSLLIRDNFSPGQQGQTLAQAISWGDQNDALLEAMWDENGVLCVEDPRVDTLGRKDVICPVKRVPGGSQTYNWQPPPCVGFVDPNPPGVRFYSFVAIE